MVVRDKELLAELTRVAGCTVCVSVPTVDEDAWRALEPGTAHPLQRLRAVKILRDAGVKAGVLMMPVVPGFTTQPAKLEATIKAVADHGAAFLGANVMYLKGGTKDHFMGFLAHEFPQMVEAYGRLYAGAHASASYVKDVRAMIDMFKQRHGMTGNSRYENAEPDETPAPAGPEQASLEFCRREATEYAEYTEYSAWSVYSVAPVVFATPWPRARGSALRHSTPGSRTAPRR